MVFVLLLVVPALISSKGAEAKQTSGKSFAKKKILVLSSNGGHGHNAAVATLKNVLEKKYELKVAYPIDKLRICGVRLDEQIYNTMLQYGWVHAINLIAKHIAPKIFRVKKKALEKMVSGFIADEEPDLVISLIPFINLPATEAAKKQQVPYLMITTDNDLRNWVHGIRDVTHPDFKVTVGNDLPTTREMLRKKRIPEEKIETMGLPLCQNFACSKSTEELHLEYGVPMDKHVILIMMGGAGSQSALSYSKKIGRLDLNAHLIVCAGKNAKLAQKLKKIRMHPSNSMTVMGFTDKVAELMSISDLIITKPGPGTINEAMSMQLPILIDNISTPLFWEKANAEMVLKYGIGQRIHNHDDIKTLVTRYLKDSELQAKTKEAYRLLPPNHFPERISKLVDSMCLKA